MADNPPDFPPVDRSVLEAIVAFAEATSEWLEMDSLMARQHGRDASSNPDLIAGWRFVAEALAEQIDISD